MKILKISILIFLVLNMLQAQSKKPVILIAYQSISGNTRLMAEAVAEGAQSIEGVEVRLSKVKDVKREDILAADAIIVGSPVHNANITPDVQRFINKWPFKNSPLKDKIGAAFVTAGGISAGEELAQMNILHSMLIYNMIVIGGPSWESAFGASAVVEEGPFASEGKDKKLHSLFIKKGKALGERAARLTLKLKN
jgi:NAD(P)H dehydrogenase (quinone)